MTGSWRDHASQAAQGDLDALLDIAFGFAEQELRARGAFFPYAAAIDADGQPRMIAVMPMEGEESTDLIDACLKALISQKDSIRAGAIVADVRLPERGTDAARAELEHVEGHAMTAFLPYTKKRFSKGIEFADVTAEPAPARIWG